MKWMKWNVMAVIACFAVIVCLTSAARAVTVASNVALFQPVSVESGEWDILLNDLTVMTDDTESAVVSTDSTLSGLWIDLGQEYNVESLYLGYKTVSAATGVKLRGYTDDQLTQVGTSITVNKSKHEWTCSGWTNVRWIKIADEGTSPAAMKDLRELRAFAQVETHGNFISEVTATATSNYVGAPNVNTEALCNNSGMTDQRGPVGNPNALSIMNGPFWQAASNVTAADITFNLGDTYDMDQMLIWNFNQMNHAERCVKHATISYSLDDVTYIDLADTNGAEDGNYTIAQILYENSQNPYSLAIDLDGIQANYVRISVLDTYGTELDPANTVGLSEVRFYGTAVPEAPIPGDTDDDGDVDADDLATIAMYWGTALGATWDMGDFNGDGRVNAADAALLAANWHYGVSEASESSVPEPMAGSLLLSLIIAVCAARPRRAV